MLVLMPCGLAFSVCVLLYHRITSEIDGSCVLQVERVPATDYEALKSPLMGLFEKRRARSFFMCAPWEHAAAWEQLTGGGAGTLLTKTTSYCIHYPTSECFMLPGLTRLLAPPAVGSVQGRTQGRTAGPGAVQHRSMACTGSARLLRPLRELKKPKPSTLKPEEAPGA